MAYDKLKLDYDALQKKFVDECDRLRKSRERYVFHEHNIKDSIVKGCQHIFDKVENYIHDQSKVSHNKTLYHKAKGSREALEHLANTEVIVVPLFADGVSLEEHAGVDPYGSNDGLATVDCTLKMPTPFSRSPTAPLTSIDPSLPPVVALTSKQP